MRLFEATADQAIKGTRVGRSIQKIWKPESGGFSWPHGWLRLPGGGGRTYRFHCWFCCRRLNFLSCGSGGFSSGHMHSVESAITAGCAGAGMEQCWIWHWRDHIGPRLPGRHFVIVVAQLCGVCRLSHNRVLRGKSTAWISIKRVRPCIVVPGPVMIDGVMYRRIPAGIGIKSDTAEATLAAPVIALTGRTMMFTNHGSLLCWLTVDMLCQSRRAAGGQSDC